MQKTLLNNGTTYLSTGAEFLPATVSHYADSSPRSVSLIYKECWKFAALPSLGYATEPPQHGSNFGATWREDTRIKTGGQEEWNQESVYCYVPGSQEISLSIATLDWEYTQVFTYVDLKTSIWDRFSSCLNICHPKMHSMFRSFLFRKIFLERPWYYINWNTCIHFKAGIEAWLFFSRIKNVTRLRSATAWRGPDKMCRKCRKWMHRRMGVLGWVVSQLFHLPKNHPWWLFVPAVSGCEVLLSSLEGPVCGSLCKICEKWTMVVVADHNDNDHNDGILEGLEKTPCLGETHRKLPQLFKFTRVFSNIISKWCRQIKGYILKYQQHVPWETF